MPLLGGGGGSGSVLGLGLGSDELGDHTNGDGLTLIYCQ
jgi:hypothetical protein